MVGNQTVAELISFLPNIEPRFQDKNQQVLVQWRDGQPSVGDIAYLISAWSFRYSSKFSEAQRDAMVTAIIWLADVAYEEPKLVALPFIQIISNFARYLPWNDTAFASAVSRLFDKIDQSTLHSRSRDTSAALTQILSQTAIPRPIADAARNAQGRLESAELGRQNLEPNGQSTSPFRLAITLPPDQVGLLNAVCSALNDVHEVLLDPKFMKQDRIAMTQAQKSGHPDAVAKVEFLCHSALLRAEGKTGGDVFRVKPEYVESIYVLAAFVVDRPVPDLKLASVSASFGFWVKVLVDVDSKNASPSTIVDRVRQKCRAGILRTFEEAKHDFFRLGNQYLAFLAERDELDANVMVNWLEAYRQLALNSENILDSTLSELLGTAMRAAREYASDARVGTLIDLLDPSRAKHPWTVPTVFPFLTSEECESLLRDMRSMQLPSVRRFLSDPGVLSRLHEHLLTTLADVDYNRYQAPARGAAPPTVDDAEREFRRFTARGSEGYRVSREWYSYKLADSGDVGRAQPLWEEVNRDARSHEERWNMAVFHVTVGEPRAAFAELWDKVRTGEAPYQHLRFVAYLVLALDPNEIAIPIVDVLRLLPVAAAQAYAYGVSPATDAATVLPIIQCIRSLAEKPIENTLRKYRNPRSANRSSREAMEKEVEAVRVSLIELKLKTTWRLWLTGYVNRYPRSYYLWEKLYETWNNDNPKVAREKLELALQYLGNCRNINDSYQLMFFLRKYLSVLQPEELEQKRALLQRLAQTSRPLIEENDKRTFDTIWPPAIRRHEADAGVVTQLRGDPWTAMAPMLVRNFDAEALTQVVGAAFSELKAIAPDVQSIDDWRSAFVRLLELLRSIRNGTAEFDSISSLNEWLGIHPIEQCQGLLAKARPLANWIHQTFAEQVQRYNLAPIPMFQRCENDPGVPLVSSEYSAIVDVIVPAGVTIEDLKLKVVRTDAVLRSEKATLMERLAGAARVSVSVSIIINPEHSADDPLVVKYSGSYSWGVVKKLPLRTEIAYSRYEFSDRLSSVSLKQDLLPGDIFLFDRPIETSEIETGFVGRDQEIAFVRNSFSDLNRLRTPIYIYGIRKVGKTSLLNRLCTDDVIPPDRFEPIYVSLFGLTEKTALVGQCMHIRREILAAFSDSRLHERTEAPAIVDGQEYQVVESWIEFINWLRRVTEPRLPVLLLDEFHNLGVPQAAPLLDLVRGSYQRRQVLFILAGWVDHEVLRKACPASQLFPLEQRPISFLSETEVSVLVRRRLETYGVNVGSGVLAHLMQLTEGHPNLVQRICGLAIEELNRHRRTVLTVTDLDRVAARIVDDGSQFTNSQLNPRVITAEERTAVNEIIKQLPREGDWLTQDRLSAEVRSSFVLPLVKKDVLTRDVKSGSVRVKGLMLERYLRSVESIEPYQDAPEKPNVAFVVDYENIAPLFPPMTTPDDIARLLRQYIQTVGNPRVCIVAANWESNPQNVQVGNAFRATGFSLLASLRHTDRQGLPKRRGNDANLADFAIYRDVYNRLIEERDSTNDTIDIYVIATGDGGFKDMIMDLVEKHRKKVRLLARRENDHLNPEHLRYEQTRAQVAQMPGEDSVPGFVIDDLTPLMRTNSDHQSD